MSESEEVSGTSSNSTNQSETFLLLSDTFYDWKYVWATITCLLIIVILMGNTLVIISVATNTRLQTKANIMLTSLSVADLLVGLVVLPIALPLMVAASSFQTSLLCVSMSLCQALSAISLAHIFAVNLDRYIAICYPLRYETLLSKSKVMIVLVVVWIIPLCLYLPTLTFAYAKTNSCNWDIKSHYYHTLISNIFFLIVVSIIIGMYVRISIVSKSQIRKIHSQTTDMNQRSSSEFKSHLKVMKAIGLILGAFIFCWTPLQVVQLITILRFTTEMALMLPTYMHFAGQFLGFLSYFNSAINPLIYAFTQPEFKRSFKVLLCECKKPKPNHMNTA